MPQDPGSIFGGLMSVCVSDSYLRDKKLIAKGIAFVFLGAFSSFLTTYLLSTVGLLL
ncbi:MAG: hypothetical protein KGI38_08375 [Thaumarchaeota archaeon]|nr:hypothetical protein [Nitrososphaerota archaeon]